MGIGNRGWRGWALGAVLAALAGCASAPHVPLPPAPVVDLPRFMGDWYVIACIPTPIERDAVDAVESYRLDPDGTVATTFHYRKGTSGGPLKVYHPRGFVRPGTGNAVWGMQFLWPIEADYRVLAVSPTYEWTVIGRAARDYAWIMARQPVMSPADYAAAEQVMTAAGYRVSELRHIPQTPLAARQP
jgi:apolipoprotein D and lipocalin family protein